MATHNDFGVSGERIAAQYLKDEGYNILETNWRYGRLEADIIAQQNDLIVFIEVKSRHNEVFGTPASFVDNKKQQAYRQLANAYMHQHRRYEEVRFDIVGIVMDEDKPRVEHIVDAFLPC